MKQEAPAVLMPEGEAARRSRIVEASPIHYGWVVLAAGALGSMATMPGQTAGVAAFLDAMILDLGLSRSTVSLMYSLGTLLGCLAMPWIGRWVDYRGPRIAVAVVAGFFALACLGMSRVSGALGLLAGFIAIRGLGQGALGLVSLHVVNLWWVRRRGFAVGLMGVGFAIAGAGFPPLVQGLIAEHGWRTTYAMLGVGVAMTILPIGILFFRDRPEAFGLSPDGQQAGSSENPSFGDDWTLPDARRTGLFWVLAIGSLLPSALGTGLIFHHFSLMSQNGISREAAAAIFIPIAVISASTNLGSGLLLDRMEPRWLLCVSLLFLAAALLFAPHVSSVPEAWVYGVFLGMMQGSQSALGGTAWAHYFGRAHHGAIRGFAFTLMVGGSAFGPLPFAWGVDVFHSYAPVLTVSALLPLGMAVLVPFVRLRAHPAPTDRENSTTQQRECPAERNEDG